MTPVEKLEAAITKLEELKRDGHPGPWHGNVTIRGVLRVQSGLAVVAEVLNTTEDEDEIDLDLIVTLHRTIDAQLAILRRGVSEVDGYTAADGRFWAVAWLEEHSTTVDLASAILGGV
jgi:hypothetical protein